MKLDHIAYRTDDKMALSRFLQATMGYKIVDTFAPFEGEGGIDEEIQCFALKDQEGNEVFVSDGPAESIVGTWVIDHGAGIHHIAYRVDNIESIVNKWKELGIVFTSDIIDCPNDNLRQIFTCPIGILGGIIIELIQRGDKGFCKSSVKNLMKASTNSNKGV